jgi:hypothetical protein
VPQRLPRFFRRQEEIEDERRLARILLETGEALPEEVKRSGAPGGDRRRLRGLPCVSKGVAGVIAGTDPVAALLAKERHGRRR